MTEPAQVAFDMGWAAALNGEPIAHSLKEATIEEQRAYMDGYRLGEHHRTGEPSGSTVLTSADRLIALDVPKVYIALVVSACVIALVLAVIFK